MAATIGADDLDVFRSPHPDLLRQLSGIEPVPAGTHVVLEEHGVKSTQRLAIGDVGELVAALWLAELKKQALYPYEIRRGSQMVEAARAQGWTAEASPQLAFRTRLRRRRSTPPNTPAAGRRAT